MSVAVPLDRARRLAEPRRALLTSVGAGALYYTSAKLGFLLEFAGPVAAIVWLPAGIGIAALYLGGLAALPGLLAADLLVDDYSALPIPVVAGQTVGNMLELLLAAYLLRRIASPFATVRGVAFMVGSIVAATAVSATFGTLSSLLGGVVASEAAPTVWRTWWLGDAVGALVVVPLAVAWWPLPRRRGVRAILAAVPMIAVVAILAELGSTSQHTPLSYLIFPALTWSAIQFGARGATLAVAVATALTVWNTTHLTGPFYYHSITRSVLSAQLYVVVAALSTLVLAAVVAERQSISDRLDASQAEMVTVAERERHRIERNLHDGAQQRLLAVAIRLGLAARQVRREPERAEPLFVAARGEVEAAIDELRQLARGLNPTHVTTIGLASAVRALAQLSPVLVELVALPAERVDDAVEAAAYYVVAESVVNAQKHAQASIVRVGARVADGRLWIEVRDDGVGDAVVVAGAGLDGLRTRVEAEGGTFAVDSPRGVGTLISASMPVRSGRAADAG